MGRKSLLAILLLVAIGSAVFLYQDKIMRLMETYTAPAQKALPPKTAKPAIPEAEKLVLPSLPSLFPSDPMIWIHLKDLGKTILKINESNFFKQTAEYKIFDLSTPIPVNKNLNISTNQKNILTKISSQLEKKTIIDILGKEIAVAFYPSNNGDQSKFLFAAKINTITKYKEKLNRLKESLLGEEGIFSEENYNNKTIITYNNKAQKFSFRYIMVADTLLVSSSDLLLKRAINLMDKKESDYFIQSEKFSSLFKASDLSNTGIVFVDIEGITSNISNIMGPSKNIPPIAIENIKKQGQFFKYLGSTLKILKGLEYETNIILNPKKDSGEFTKTIALEPRITKSLSLISGDVIAYGTSIIDPKSFFDQLSGNFNPKKNDTADEKSLNNILIKSLGINLNEDIVPYIGNEFFFSVSKGDKTGSMPLPTVNIGFEIKSKVKLLFNLKKIKTIKKHYKGFDYHLFPSPFGTQFGYTTAKNFLIFSTSQMGMEELINTFIGKTQLLQKNPKFVSAGFPEKNNGMFFLNATLLWSSLSESLLTTPPKFFPMFSADIVERGIKFLDVLETVNSVNNVFIYEKNQIYSKTFISITDLPKIRTNKELRAFLKDSRQKLADSILPAPSQTPASVSFTYDPTGKRNPFNSLLTGRKETTQRNVKLIETLGSLEPINLYLYKKIQKEDPALYKKLKSHARFFRNEKVLEKHSQEEKELRLDDYKHLIAIARNDFHDEYIGPLQSGYSALKLAGIIRGEKETLALIETQGKGYSVKVNDFLGPNYGIIKKIEQDRVIVIEKYVTHLAKTIEKRQEIKLLKEEDSI